MLMSWPASSPAVARLSAMRTANVPPPMSLIVFDLADDLVEDLLVLDRRERHLDALLDRDRLRARLNGARVRADVIDGGESGTRDASSGEARDYPSARRGNTTGCLAERQ